MFEVERKVFFACARQGQQTLTTRGAKNLNYATLRYSNEPCIEEGYKKIP
jgi:hypothetical protein